MAFNNYLEDENDKPYFTTNSLAYYYDKMEGFAEKVEGSAKALNLTKEEVEKRLTLYIEQNKNELDQRLAQWDGKLETFDSSVETLLTEWVDDGTLTPLIDSTLIDQKIAPVTAQLADKVGGVRKATMDDLGQDVKTALTGGSVAVVGIGSVGTVNVQSKAITEEKTTFFQKSSNLYNKNSPDNLIGKMLNSTGEVTALETSTISHPIDVLPGETITADLSYSTYGGSAKVHCYNAEGARVTRIDPVYVGNLSTFTIPQDTTIKTVKFNVPTSRTVAVMFVKGNVYPSVYVPFSFKLNETIRLNTVQKEEVSTIAKDVGRENPLYGKIAVYDGDSIANDLHGAYDGWAGRITTKNNMVYTNHAVDGGTVTAGVLTTGGGNRHWVSRNVQNYRTDADYIILEGGTNDADLIGVNNMGAISYGFNAVLDDTTFTGAVESTLKQAILKYPGKKIGFILAHRSGSIDQQIPRRAFFDRIIECCEKWGVPYLDIFKLSYLNSDLPHLKATYFIDKSHLSDAGYDLITPLVEKWMKTL